MRSHSRKSLSALTVVILSLMIIALACTANDTWIIKLTVTPTPTITSTPLSIETRFKIGDVVYVAGVADFSDVNLQGRPGDTSAARSGGSCFPGSSTKVQDVSVNQIDANDKTIFYYIECPGLKRGWLPEGNLSSFNRGQKAIVKAAAGDGAVMFVRPDSTGQKRDAACPNGTEVSISSIRKNPVPTDPTVYVEIRCENVSGFVVEQDLISKP